jgi:hypothetical protein
MRNDRKEKKDRKTERKKERKKIKKERKKKEIQTYCFYYTVEKNNVLPFN